MCHGQVYGGWSCVSWVVAVVPRASGCGSNQAAMLSCTRVDGARPVEQRCPIEQRATSHGVDMSSSCVSCVPCGWRLSCCSYVDRGNSRGNWVRWCVVLIVKRRRGSSLAPHHMVVTCRCHACARHGSSAVMLPCPCVSWGRHVWGFPVPSRNHGGMLSCRRVDGGGRDTAHGDAKYNKTQ